jgi:NAD(P)-dependent dehydrogenase (short-subunit alcohol dehydrogenase family)
MILVLSAKLGQSKANPEKVESPDSTFGNAFASNNRRTMAEKTAPRLAVVTGFSSGIGFEVARGLAEQGWRVLGVARSQIRGRRAVEILRAQTGNPGIHFFTADLSLLSETRTLGQRLVAGNPKIDLLINNAGAIFSQREETEEGHERTLALNHLSPFVLTETLLPSLTGRIINVTSSTHHGAQLNLDDLGMAGNYSGWRQYQHTKLMNVLFTRKLSELLPEHSTASCLHPGFVRTRIGSNNGLFWRLAMKMQMLMAVKPREAARGVLRLALESGLSGLYFDRGHPATPSPAGQDGKLAEALWNRTREIVSK